MGLFDYIHKQITYRRKSTNYQGPSYEFCPRCEANLTLQKGYSNKLPYWYCRGCGETLINPAVPGDSDIAWICDGCEAMLNIQDGFNENVKQWTCTECGYVNIIDESEIYVSEDEFKASIKSPYRGLSDEAVLELSEYEELSPIGNRDDIVIVRSIEDGQKYVKKILKTYDESVYTYLMANPIQHMPRICRLYKSDNSLIVIEEHISGRTLADILDEKKVLSAEESIAIAMRIATIAKQLHTLDRPIIHRDIKPSNIIITPDKDVYLLDMNVAKWYDADEIEDTKLLGTQYYAAPEQLGYGFSASSEKSDIYAIGMLLNVMATGKFPKEQKAPVSVWDIVSKCICLEPADRLTDSELIEALNSYAE